MFLFHHPYHLRELTSIKFHMKDAISNEKSQNTVTGLELEG